MSWLVKYFRTGYRNIAIAGTLLPPETVANFAAGVTGVDNPGAGRTDLTVVASGMTQQSVSGGGTITATVNSWVFVDATGGNVTVNFPAPIAAAQIGVADAMHGSPPAPTFTAGHAALINNPSSNIEDPNNPGTFTTNPIVIDQPSATPLWQANPGASLWKVVA